MRLRQLGTSALQVSPIMLGGNVFGWTADESTSFRILDAFVDAGFNFIDTADVYSRWAPGHEGGESETVLGRWLAASGKRDKVVIATKVGMDMGPGGTGLSKKHILESVDRSLRRLQTDAIDLYQSHQDDEATPLEETAEAYGLLLRQGKVRFVGASNFKAGRLREALRTTPYVSLQPLYNLYDRQDYETNLAPVVKEAELGVIPYFSLGAGFLTGKYRSQDDLTGKPRDNRVRGYLNERGMTILAALDEVAAKHNATPAQTALAWLMTRPGITAPITSATSVGQLKELLAAVELQLSSEDLSELDRRSAL